MWSETVCYCRVRVLEGHKARVGTMAWSSHILSTGSRDRSILQRDIRAPEDFQTVLRAHRSEVGSLLLPHCCKLLVIQCIPGKPLHFSQS